MARLQRPVVIDLGVINTTPKQISATTINCTSFIVQAPQGNTDFIRIGNSAGQLFELAPGKELSPYGDNLDVGATAYLDLSDWYVVSASGNQTGNVIYLERF